MRILGIVLAVIAILLGLRMVFSAIYMAFSGKVMVRQGLRNHWVTAPSMNDAWKMAFRNALMGLLLVILGVALVI